MLITATGLLPEVAITVAWFLVLGGLCAFSVWCLRRIRRRNPLNPDRHVRDRSFRGYWRSLTDHSSAGMGRTRLAQTVLLAGTLIVLTVTGDGAFAAAVAGILIACFPLGYLAWRWGV